VGFILFRSENSFINFTGIKKEGSKEYRKKERKKERKKARRCMRKSKRIQKTKNEIEVRTKGKDKKKIRNSRNGRNRKEGK
jgi:hypothetical protein